MGTLFFLLLILSTLSFLLPADYGFWGIIEMIENGGSSVPCSDGVPAERARRTNDRSSQTEGLMRASES